MRGLLRKHVVITGGLVVFGGLYLSTIDSYGMLMWDEAHYATLGRALARGEGYTNYAGKPDTFRPPVVPAAAALSMFISRSESDVVAKLPIVGFALLCLLLVYGVVQHQGGTLAGVVGATALGIFPTFWQDTAYLLTEIPFMLFYAGAVVLFHDGLFRNPRSFLLAWPCWALAVLTRYTAVLFGPTVLLLSLMPFAFRDSEAIKRMRSKEFFVGPVMAFLILTPWLVRTWMYTGDPLGGFTRAAGQIPAHSHATMPALFYLQELPGMIGWIPLAMLAAAFVFVVVVRQQALGITCCIAALIVIGWMQQYDWKEVRLITATMPFFAILIGLGVAAAVEALPKRRRQWAPLVIIAVIGAAFVMSYRQATALLADRKTLGYPSFLHAMAYLEEETAQGALLLGSNCYQIYWYADRPCRMFPKKESELATALDGTEWAVITNFERGQPQYLRDAVKHFGRAEYASGRVKPFTDNRWATALVSPEVLRASR